LPSTGVSRARRIVDFRNRLAHEYPSISDSVVWAIADDEVPVLREECRLILADRGDDVETG
jgi:uncharacterized protein with HEPN domain